VRKRLDARPLKLAKALECASMRIKPFDEPQTIAFARKAANHEQTPIRVEREMRGARADHRERLLRARVCAARLRGAGDCGNRRNDRGSSRQAMFAIHGGSLQGGVNLSLRVPSSMSEKR
jgi:hypothetical protein